MGEPHDVSARIGNNEPVTQPESKKFFDWLAYATRERLRHSCNLNFKAAAAPGAPVPKLDIRNDPLHGHCSFTQNIASYALSDRDIPSKQFSAQSLPGYTVGHATLSVTVQERDGPATYIVDPTYRQFCDPKTPTYEGKPMPGFVLKDMEGGPAIIKSLMTDGYIKATPDIAQKYLASFTGGVSTFESPKDAMSFLKNPPYDGGRNFFSRNSMQRNEALIAKQA